MTTPNLGQSCNGDPECGGENRLCWRGAVQQGSSGALRPGICVEPCAADRPCLAAGTTCTPFAVGLDAGNTSLCVPSQRFFSVCDSDAPCAAEGLVCTVYDHPKVGPATVCDRPLASGTAAGTECDSRQLCANGLCVPRVPPPLVPASCTQVCNKTSCPAGSTCVLSEFGVQDGLRHLPLCVPVATTCIDCAASATACQADAPHCTHMGSSSRCLAECTPSDAGGSFPVCPNGLRCALLAEGPRCIPESGICP